MKRITIFQENISPIVIEDEDNTDIIEYSNELAKSLSTPNITMIATSSCCFITRPNMIASIVVNELNKKIEIDNEDLEQIKKEDIITD